MDRISGRGQPATHDFRVAAKHDFTIEIALGFVGGNHQIAELHRHIVGGVQVACRLVNPKFALRGEVDLIRVQVGRRSRGCRSIL